MRLSLRNLATAGMVLLKGQDILPLQESLITDESPLVLIGRHALETSLQGGGSAAVRPPHQISIADGLTKALGEDRVRVLDGVAVRHNPTAAAPELIIDPETGRPGMRITSFDGSGARAGVHEQRSCRIRARHVGWTARGSERPRAFRRAGRASRHSTAGRRTRGRRVDAELRRRDVRICQRPATRRSAGSGLHGAAELDSTWSRRRPAGSSSPGW